MQGSPETVKFEIKRNIGAFRITRNFNFNERLSHMFALTFFLGEVLIVFELWIVEKNFLQIKIQKYE